MRATARLLTFLFHPLLFTTYMVCLLGIFMPRFLYIPMTQLWKFAGFIAIITFVFPAANLLMLRMFGSIGSLEMQRREDRVLPFIMITIFYGVVCAMFFYKVTVNVNFNKLMLIAAILAGTATVSTFFFKVSVHSLAMGGALGIILLLNKASDGELLFPSAVLMVIAGMVISSRLYLQAHTLREVGYGAALGFLVGSFGMIILF